MGTFIVDMNGMTLRQNVQGG